MIGKQTKGTSFAVSKKLRSQRGEIQIAEAVEEKVQFGRWRSNLSTAAQ